MSRPRKKGLFNQSKIGAKRKRKATRCKLCKKDKYLDENKLCLSCRQDQLSQQGELL